MLERAQAPMSSVLPSEADAQRSKRLCERHFHDVLKYLVHVY